MHLSPYINFTASPSPSGSAPWELKSAPLHPAIRPQYGAPSPHSPAYQLTDHAWSPAPQTPNSGPPSRPSSPHSAVPKTQSFAKQSHSPIPLPSYVKQLATSSSTGVSKASPLSQPPEQPSPTFELADVRYASTPPTEQKVSPTGVDGSGIGAPPQQSFDDNDTSALLQEPSGQRNSPQPFDWVPSYQDKQPLPPTRSPAPPPTAYPEVPEQHSYRYYQAPEHPQPQHEPDFQYDEPASEYPPLVPGPEYSANSAESMSIVERMMMNLKRATQAGSRPE
jgi:hypothetical protein